MTMPTVASPSNVTAHLVALALAAAALVLAVVGVAVASTGAVLGALALVGVAWLVHDHARAAEVAP